MDRGGSYLVARIWYLVAGGDVEAELHKSEIRIPKPETNHKQEALMLQTWPAQAGVWGLRPGRGLPGFGERSLPRAESRGAARYGLWGFGFRVSALAKELTGGQIRNPNVEIRNKSQARKVEFFKGFRPKAGFRTL